MRSHHHTATPHPSHRSHAVRWPVLLTCLVLTWGLASPAGAVKRCGPEIGKKKVEVIEVEADHPRSALEELEGARGTELEVIAEDLVESSSNPVRTARIEAAYRGCRLLIAGDVERRDAAAVDTIGTGGAPSTRRRWTKVARVLFVVEKPAEEGGDAGPAAPAPLP